MRQVAAIPPVAASGRSATHSQGTTALINRGSALRRRWTSVLHLCWQTALGALKLHELESHTSWLSLGTIMRHLLTITCHRPDVRLVSYNDQGSRAGREARTVGRPGLGAGQLA